MIVMKKALPRRTFLRGAGTALALPLLDAMVPSLTALAETPASPAKLRRLGFVYMPMGCDVTRWTPGGAGKLEELSPMEVSFEPGAPAEVVPVSFESVVTETGMLQLWCVARDGRRWKLEFNVRERVQA